VRRERKNCQKKPCKHQGQTGRKGRRCSRTWIPICVPGYRYFSAACGGFQAGAGRYVLKEAAANGAGEECDEELLTEINYYKLALTLHSPSPYTT